MASLLLSSTPPSLCFQSSAIIIISDLHHFNASSSMQFQGSMQWLLNFPELLNKFGVKSAITFLIDFVGKIGFKNVSEIAIISLIEISKEMEILVYHEEGDIIEAIHTDIIAADLEDWNSLARRIFELWRQRNDGEAPEISEAINPANCWPGYTTECSEYLPEEANSSLEFFQWGVDSWEDVKDRLNCLEVRPQHKDHDIDQGEQ